MPGVCADTNLMEMASRGQDGVPVSAVVKLVKLAYCYEHWDVFDNLIGPLKIFIQVSSHCVIVNSNKEPSHSKKESDAM